MKKFILYSTIVLFLAGPCFAQKKDSIESVGAWVERQYAEQKARFLKSYYTDPAVAEVCESWYSCAKWAFEQYEQDQSFKIVKAEFKTLRKVHRHRVTQETHLFVEGTYTHRTVRLEFITPKGSGRTRPYIYIAQFPK